MDMSRLPQHVEDELQAFLKLLCLSLVVLKSHVPKKSIETWKILVKEEKIELFSKVKEETIELPSKGKEVLQIVHKFPKLTHFLFSWFEHKKNKGILLMGPERIPPSFWRLGPRKLGTSWCSKTFIGDEMGC
jgi:hypothetical protein